MVLYCRKQPDLYVLFRVDGGKMLYEAIGDNTSIHSMDLRLCQVGSETEIAVREHVKSTELKADQTKRSGA